MLKSDALLGNVESCINGFRLSCLWSLLEWAAGTATQLAWQSVPLSCWLYVGSACLQLLFQAPLLFPIFANVRCTIVAMLFSPEAKAP